MCRSSASLSTATSVCKCPEEAFGVASCILTLLAVVQHRHNLFSAFNHTCLSSQGQEPPGLPDNEAVRLLVACSGKMAMLAAMLPRLLAGGHRVLIFAQLKGVLTLLEDMLHDFPHMDALPQCFRRNRGANGYAAAKPDFKQQKYTVTNVLTLPRGHATRFFDCLGAAEALPKEVLRVL